MSAPSGHAALQATLARLGITVTRIEHPPVHTVEEALPHWAALAGTHTKNLFLKDARGSLVLVTLPADRRADLKGFAATLGAKKFSFASAETLQDVLGIQPGAVSPLALVNDAGRRVRFVLDAALADAPVLTFHPLSNTATLALDTRDFLRFLDDIGHPAEIVRLDA